MRALVTGAAGFVGLHLVRGLLEDGWTVHAGALEWGPGESGVEGSTPLSLDVTSAESVAAAVAEARPEVVFHLAGLSSVAESFADPLVTWDVNATGTLRLLAAVGGAARFVFVSSAEVYGVVPEEDQPIAEDRRLCPVNPYGASKAAGEIAAVQAVLAGKADAVVARSFNHTGPGQSPRFALPAFAHQLVALDAAGPPVLRVGNLDARRDVLDVRDVVRAYRLLADAGNAGEVYNVCSGRAYRIGDLVEGMVEISGTGARVEVDPERFRPVEVPLLQGDPSRLRALGWEPRIALRRTMEDLLDEARSRAGA